MPGWIDDVVTQTTIRSVWGNTIRDQVVQSFASIAERNANNAKTKEGMIAWAAAERTLAIRVAGVWIILSQPWQNYSPVVQVGTTVVSGGNGPNYWRSQYQRTYDTVACRWEISGLIPATEGGAVWIALPYVCAGNAARGALMGNSKLVEYSLGTQMHGPAMLDGNLTWCIPQDGGRGNANLPAGISGATWQAFAAVTYPVAPGTALLDQQALAKEGAPDAH